MSKMTFLLLNSLVMSLSRYDNKKTNLVSIFIFYLSVIETKIMVTVMTQKFSRMLKMQVLVVSFCRYGTWVPGGTQAQHA